jgi:hypothetical protein
MQRPYAAPKGKFPLNFGQLLSQTLDESAKVMYNLGVKGVRDETV